MLNRGDINKSFLEVFHSMKEGVVYELVPDSFKEMNTSRREKNLDDLKPFVFKRGGENLIFDWKTNGWASIIVKVDDNKPLVLALALGAVLPLALSFTLALAFAEGQIREVKNDSCDGKVVEIEGRKYKLMEI